LSFHIDADEVESTILPFLTREFHTQGS